MSNRLYIQDYNREKDPVDFPLIDDVLLELTSQFGSFSDIVPKAGDILDTATMIKVAATGTLGAGLLNANNLFDIPRWKKTDPIKFTAKLIFYLETDPIIDIYDPMVNFISYTILTKKENGEYVVPGISVASNEAFQSNGEKGIAENAKIVSISIPGVVYLPVAMIERVQTTFSKEITERGFPLWGQLDATIMGCFPANTGMFDQAKLQGIMKGIPSIP